jgi:hypothetical protein
MKSERTLNNQNPLIIPVSFSLITASALREEIFSEESAT